MLGVSYYQQKEVEHLSSYHVELCCKNKSNRNTRYSFKYSNIGRKKKKKQPRAALTRDIRVAFVLTVYEYWSEGALQIV